MIVPASGHQVRCIPWVQMGTLNKEIGFLRGLKFFALNIFGGEYLQSSLHLMLQIWWKPLLSRAARRSHTARMSRNARRSRTHCVALHACHAPLTLSQWFSSGNPVAIQCAWNLDPSIHWNATGERNVGSQCVSSVLPVVFQWLSSGLPVCSYYAN